MHRENITIEKKIREVSVYAAISVCGMSSIRYGGVACSFAQSYYANEQSRDSMSYIEFFVPLCKLL